jgi:hypothetical protein
MNDEQLRYPIGKFSWEKTDWQLEELLEAVLQIQSLPESLSRILKGVTPDDLQRSYRTGGWTALQVIHHLADSHLNAWVRTKLLLTENEPVIKPWEEELWAAGEDYGYSHEASFMILLGLHQRWSLLLLNVLKKPELLQRGMQHPQLGKRITLAQLIAMYGWHSTHHLMHLKLALGR